MLKRKQIQLTPRQAQAIRREAARRGISDAAVIRGLVDQLLVDGTGRNRDQRWQRLFAVVGRYRSGRRDIAREHDRYLADDFGE